MEQRDNQEEERHMESIRETRQMDRAERWLALCSFRLLYLVYAFHRLLGLWLSPCSTVERLKERHAC